MDSVEATRNSSNDLLGSILLKIDNTFSKCSQPNMPKAKPQNTTTKVISENYKHSDPLGLETEFPTEYMKLVRKLIREDDPTPQMETEADQEDPTVNTIPQNVIALHERLVHGTNQLFDVPKSISAKIGA